jgi:hypothetical protein
MAACGSSQLSLYSHHTLLSPLSIPTVHLPSLAQPRSIHCYSPLLNHTLSLASPIFLPSQSTHCAALHSPGLDRSQAPRFGHPRLILSICTAEIELGGKLLDGVWSDTQMETRRSHSSTSTFLVRIRSTEALQYLINDYRVK